MLLGLLAVGLVVRVAFMLAIRPISYGLNDSGTYMGAASGAGSSLFYDVHHPVGYSIMLDVVTPVFGTGTALAILQHLLGLLAVAGLYKAGTTFGAPRWAAALPALGYAVSFDVVQLEHSILSEALYLPAIVGVLYAAARLYVAQRWRALVLSGLLLGVAAGVTYTARYPGLLLCGVAPVVALILVRGRIGRRGAALAVTVVGVLVVMAPYQLAQDSALGIGLKLTPGNGWNAYASVAGQADCRRFTPPPGTRKLCQSAKNRAGKPPEYYSYGLDSPGRRIEPRGFPFSDERFQQFADAATASLPEDPNAGPGGLRGRVLQAFRAGGVVFGPLGWAPELIYRNPQLEPTERDLGKGLISLAPMSFHPPLQPLSDLRPYVRVTGSLALIAMLVGLIGAVGFGLRGGLFVLILIGSAFIWASYGVLPRYAVPIYLIASFCFPLGVAGLVRRRGRDDPPTEAPAPT